MAGGIFSDDYDLLLRAAYQVDVMLGANEQGTTAGGGTTETRPEYNHVYVHATVWSRWDRRMHALCFLDEAGRQKFAEWKAQIAAKGDSASEFEQQVNALPPEADFDSSWDVPSVEF